MAEKPKTIISNQFHIGSTCPFCQETISENQRIVICPECAGIHHESCWDHHNGCSSYTCDKRSNVGENAIAPEIVITSGDLEKVIVPPKPVRASPEEVARQYLPPTPVKTSLWAIASTVMMGMTFCGIVFFFYDSKRIIAAAVLSAIIAIVTALIAMVRVNINRKLRGMYMAGSTIIISSILLIVYVAVLGYHATMNSAQQVISLNLNNIPDDTQLSQLDPLKARALRANTVVKCSARGFIGNQLMYGSGVITRIKDKRAYILTNKHVFGISENAVDVGDDRNITVILYNREESNAKIEWLAPKGMDIAIISCDALMMNNYSPVPIQKDLSIASTRVFAVGNPMRLFWSYTEGIISSIRKKDLGANDFIDVYQTQTPINQGNSGGGLYNINGFLIGINTWVHNKAVSEGLNFAISTTSIIKMLDNKAQNYFYFGNQPAKQKENENKTGN